jgi:prepilin signal peptidase PulO-like enzyme (type II secretory pathway)
MMPGIEYFNLAGAASTLLYTSYLDLKRREVEDKVWIISGLFAALLQAYEIYTGFSPLLPLLLSVGLSTLVGMGLYFFGFYGGADGKALIVVATFVPIFIPHVGMYDIAPIIVLTNGVVISMFLPAYLVILNVVRLIRGMKIFDGFDEPVHRKFLACLLGYKQYGNPRPFQFSLERTAELPSAASVASQQRQSTVVRKFDFSLMRDDFEEHSGKWVTPGIPLLVFFTVGFFALLTYGDLIIGLIKFLAKLA